jgi:hypothetical protein
VNQPHPCASTSYPRRLLSRISPTQELSTLIGTELLYLLEYKPIVTDTKTTALATLLLLASLHTRKLHVSSVTTAQDIRLIALSKKKGLAITCDVSVYSLSFSQADYPECKFLPTGRDQKALWEHLPFIGVFSIGSIPYQLAVATGQKLCPAWGSPIQCRYYSLPCPQGC